MIKTRVTAALFAIFLFKSITKADVVTDWNVLMLTTVSAQNPFAQARLAAITHVAMFEAVNSVTREYDRYLRNPIIAPPGASAEAAAVAAAHAVLKNYFPANSANLDAARAMSLAGIPDGSAKDGGIATGEAAAQALIALRANDGSGPPEFYLPSSSNAGDWQRTPSCPAAGGTLLHWRNVTPFGIRSADQFRSDSPPALNGSRYARDYNEVRAVGAVNSAERAPDRSDVARFYNVAGAPFVWNLVARQLAAAKRHSLAGSARAFALLNMAMSDGAVAVFEAKYHYNAWRPETAIRAGDTDGNSRTEPDATFAPFITTPCFPSYPSAHATLSNAAREVIERIYGNGSHRITVSSPDVAGVTLHYVKLREITNDIDDARIYGGIHFRFDQDAGADQGRRVGAYIVRRNLRRASDCSCADEEENQ